MQQLEIKYFWPLTEQIPLDLDFTECNKPKLSEPVNSIGSFTITGDDNIGALCGRTYEQKDIVVKNVSVVNSTITGDYYVGGLVGLVDSNGNIKINVYPKKKKSKKMKLNKKLLKMKSILIKSLCLC